MPSRPPASVDERRSALAEQRPHLRRLIAFTLAGWLLVLAPSWYMLEVYDRVATTRNGLTLLMLTAAVLLLCGWMQGLEWVRAEMMRGLGEKFEAALAPRVFRAAFQSMRRRSGAAVAAGPSDLRQLREFAASPVPLALLDFPGALLFLALLLAISPWVALAALVLAAVHVAVTLAQDRQCRPLLTLAGQRGAQAVQWADTALSQAATHQALGMVEPARARWQQAQDEARASQRDASWASGRYQAASRFLQQLTGSALLGLSAYLLLQGALPGGGAMLIVASILGGRLMAPLAQVVAHWSALGNARDAWKRLGELLLAFPAPEAAMPLARPRGDVSVQALTVPSPAAAVQAAPLLGGVGFQLAAGEALVVLGPSGAGKSTLMRALLGLLPAHGGSVRLDGVEVQTWNKDELGPAVGYLPQAVDLLDGTLADNVCRFGSVDAERLAEALDATGLAAWVRQLPRGPDTPVGPQGHDLSAGQRQRVALARAIYGWPALVVLDEPNASLDAAGDAALDQTLAALRQRRCTVVAVSHRTSVLRHADRLLLLQDGCTKAFGPRDEVMQALHEAAARSAARPAAGASLPRPGFALGAQPA